MRYYNGYPDPELQAVIDSRKSARERLEAEIPGARCTYYPTGELYMVWTSDFQPIGGYDATFRSVESAVESAIQTARAS